MKTRALQHNLPFYPECVQQFSEDSTESSTIDLENNSSRTRSKSRSSSRGKSLVENGNGDTGSSYTLAKVAYPRSEDAQKEVRWVQIPMHRQRFICCCRFLALPTLRFHTERPVWSDNRSRALSANPHLLGRGAQHSRLLPHSSLPDSPRAECRREKERGREGVVERSESMWQRMRGCVCDWERKRGRESPWWCSSLTLPLIAFSLVFHFSSLDSQIFAPLLKRPI